jgi:hypothetical protein
MTAPTAQSSTMDVGMPAATNCAASSALSPCGRPSVSITLNCFVSAAFSSNAVTTRDDPCTSTVLPSWTKLWPISAMCTRELNDMPANI